MSGQYSIKIPVFEGPLDLLLHLIKKNEIDIYDIPISLITGQYLEYIGIMKELNLEIAGEFLVMAATLIQIKSRMLLPIEEQGPEGEGDEDPRLELVQRLLEYQAFKEASLALKEWGQQWSEVRYRTSEDEEEPDEKGGETLPLSDISLFDLIQAFQRILEKAPPELQNISRQTLSLNDSVSRILERLEEKETVRFEELFPEGAAKSHLIVTFVAILEILKLGLARVYQEEKFGPIWVIRAAEERLEDDALTAAELGAVEPSDMESMAMEPGALEPKMAPEEIFGDAYAEDAGFAAQESFPEDVAAGDAGLPDALPGINALTEESTQDEASR
ncbi:MAG: segregation/condensation protein A [Nitrospiraceae bacterium]|nr:segregation/condensation protein A [Nitrospiraceae bacterium]